MQCLLAFAVGVELFGEVSDFLFLLVVGFGEGEGFEAAGFVITRIITYA